MVINNFTEDTNIIPIASIGLPVYNGEKYLSQAIESVISQTIKNFELIISDNASTDSTSQICEYYLNRDKRIRYFSQTSNIGPINNFSFVLSKSKANFFTWIAHDDMLYPNFLEECLSSFEENPNSVLISGDVISIDSTTNEIDKIELINIRYDIPWNIKSYEFFRYPISNVFFCIYGLYKTPIISKVFSKIRPTPLAGGSELPILSRVASHGEISSIPKVLRKYRIHKNSIYTDEIEKLRKTPIRGFLLRTYNKWWLRWDQAMVLLGSSFPIKLKVRIIYRVTCYYLFTHSFNIISEIARRTISFIKQL